MFRITTRELSTFRYQYHKMFFSTTDRHPNLRRAESDGDLRTIEVGLPQHYDRGHESPTHAHLLGTLGVHDGVSQCGHGRAHAPNVAGESTITHLL